MTSIADLMSMIVFTFLLSSAPAYAILSVDLARVSEHAPEQTNGDTASALQLTLFSSNEIRLGDTPVNLEKLPEILMASHSTDAQRLVCVACERDTRWESMAAVVTAINSAGFRAVFACDVSNQGEAK